MVDLNTSGEYDSESLRAYLNERRARNSLSGAPLGLATIFEDFSLSEESKIELVDPIAFLKSVFPDKPIFRFILTHPDLDHMRGLKRLFDQVQVLNFWDTAHTKETPDFRSDGDREDWAFYQKIRNRGTKALVHNFRRGDRMFAFGAGADGSGGGDEIEILSPTNELINSCNAAKKSNDLSFVIRVAHAGKSVLLTGDAEKEAWEDMVRVYGKALKSDALKASHHGRDSGFHLNAVQHIAPSVTLVSCGRKPETDASNKYRYHCNSVFSTRWYGNIQLNVGDDGSWQWYVDRNGS